MKKSLEKWEIELFADIQKADYKSLLQIKKFLDPKQIRFLLIKNEYHRRTFGKRVRKTNVVKDLSKQYGVSISYIETIIYNKDPNKGRECVRCGKYTPNYWWNKNDGVCRRCFSDIETSIKIQTNDNKEGGSCRDESS